VTGRLGRLGPTMVMSTGIVSIDLSHLGGRWPSVALLAAAGADWMHDAASAWTVVALAAWAAVLVRDLLYGPAIGP
jgi:hypothetical protein